MIPMPRRESVLLNGQPKTGTTWLELILTSILHLCCKPPSCTFTDDKRQPCFEQRQQYFGTPARSERLVNLTLWAKKHALPVRLAPRAVDTKAYAADHLRAASIVLLKECVATSTHSSIWSDECLSRVIAWPVAALRLQTKHILLLRDPRAVVVSWYHYIGANLSRKNSTALSQATARQAAAQSLRYVVHMRFTRSTLPVFYEDLLQDPHYWYAALATYLGFLPSSPEIDAVVNQSSAASMRAREAAGKLPGSTARPYNRQGAKVLTASANAWQNDLSSRAASTIQGMTHTMCDLLVSPLRFKWVDCDLE
eukprot:CAMPEP_0119378248 /NCGR_PEP_ID=MMETSP1334-20130426/47491_1 /TAXON_ID=127549 /ORGANISM="Calcidiscus leptoporus, Strain RCC1130" /LENGTH=309 /DNA_ID=CAMNT_0007397383 /DNA_START=90 /DNA_END=1019 /DNA_ORIENTATION=+